METINTEITTTGYVLCHKETGSLLRITGDDGNKDVLCDYDGDLFLLEDLTAMEYVYQNNTPWYNANEVTPSHDSVDMTEYTICEYKKEVKQECKPLEVTFPTKSQIEAFIRETYSKPEYHNDEKAIERMVKQYVEDECYIDQWMYTKLKSWIKENTYK